MSRYVFVAPDSKIDLWRTHWPAQGLMGAGEEVVVLGVGSKTTDVDLTPDDVVILHVTNQATRQVAPDGSIIGAEFMVDYCQQRGGRIVLSFDDDYTAHSDVQEVDPAWYVPMMGDLASAIRKANLVIVATPPLVDVYARWARRIAVVRNYPPARLWAQDFTPPDERPRVVGYMGFVGTPERPLPHRADLAEVIGDVLAERDLWAVGDREGVGSMNPTDRWVRGTGALPQEKPPDGSTTLYEAMSEAAVGIAPLRRNRWNRSKSWIKALEFAIGGVPCVVPAWHPAYAELQAVVPVIPYAQGEIAGAIESILGLDGQEYESWCIATRETARSLSMESAGVGAWREALTMLT